MIKVLRNQRGYMLLNVIALTLITSFSALILMNGAMRFRNNESSLKLIAFHLANEQLAFLESRAAQGENISGSYSFPGKYKDDLIINFDESGTLEFKVDTNVSGSGNLAEVKVIVTWQFNGKDFKIAVERTVYIAE